jgi:hypothetical protein
MKFLEKKEFEDEFDISAHTTEIIGKGGYGRVFKC